MKDGETMLNIREIKKILAGNGRRQCGVEEGCILRQSPQRDSVLEKKKKNDGLKC